MSMERLKSMKNTLMGQVEAQIGGNLQCVDAEELGEAVDMIKDLSEAIYYCSVVEAMEKQEKEESQQMYYTTRMNPDYYRDMDKEYGRMYYSGNRNMNNMRNYSTEQWRDPKEGRSYNSRRMYMESKEMHQGKEKQMQELERYMQELSQDIVEMIHDASPEEKITLQQKITALAQKIK